MISLLAGIATLKGCAPTINDAPPQQQKPIGMANPVNVYCSAIDGTQNAKQNADGCYFTCSLLNGQEV